MGSNLSTARDFLEIHERLDEDIRDKAKDMEALIAAADALPESEAPTAQERVKELQKQWGSLHALVQHRIKLALTYVGFHKKAQNVSHCSSSDYTWALINRIQTMLDFYK